MKRVWGVIPSAGLGTRIQPLAFSKELLPVGIRRDGDSERPRAVSEYLVERMILGGATRICFVVSPSKTDILSYFGGQVGGTFICYAVQQNPNGLCDALFTALPFLGPDDSVLIGLPDTVWFPLDGFQHLPDDKLSFLLFPVDRPQLFDAVVCEPDGRVREVQVKSETPDTHWVWGAFKMPSSVLTSLYELWCERDHQDEYFGTLVNAYIARGGRVAGVKAGENYVDVGTLHGYREAVRVLSENDLLAGHVHR